MTVTDIGDGLTLFVIAQSANVKYILAVIFKKITAVVTVIHQFFIYLGNGNPDNQIIGSVVEEDVAFGPENMGVNVDEMWERVLDSLSKVGMQAYRKSSPNKLSGGQKQRVAIAGTLAMKPKCIVLDEPTAMLDPIGRSEVIDVITKLNKQENVTIILITHYLEEIENADVVFVMSEGKIVMQGTPGQIFARQDELREYKLEVPQTAILSKMLYDGGVINRKTVMNTEELVEVIAKAFEIKQDI